MSIKDAPSSKDGTTDESSTNNKGFQRGWFTNLRLAEQAPDQLADFTAIAAHHLDIDTTVNQGVRHGTADITALAQNDNDVPAIDYDLPCKQLDHNHYAIRVGQYVNKNGDVYVVGPRSAIRRAVTLSLDADPSDVVSYELSSGPMGLSRQSKILMNVAEYVGYEMGTWNPSTTFDGLDLDRALNGKAASAVEYGSGYIVVIERVRDDLVAGWAVDSSDEAAVVEQVGRVVTAAKTLDDISSSAIRLETKGDA